jgi:hemerythrin
MALLTWSDKYSVGVKAMDQQHISLVDTLNDLHAAMMKGLAQDTTGPLLHKLVTYTRDHFAAEESVMVAAKFPGLSQHRLKHRDLTKQVEEFVARYERGEITVNVHLMNFLRDWLANHIQKEDIEYGRWINQQAAL